MKLASLVLGGPWKLQLGGISAFLLGAECVLKEPWFAFSNPYSFKGRDIQYDQRNQLYRKFKDLEEIVYTRSDSEVLVQSAYLTTSM